MDDRIPAPARRAIPELITPELMLRRRRVLTFDAADEARRALEARLQTKVSCKAGCSNCCRQKILITSGEGAAIYLYLRAANRWDAGAPERFIEADAAMTRLSHDEWYRRKLPCPLLDERRGVCTVHPVRPMGCLMTFSVGPPASCILPDPPPGEGQVQVDGLLPTGIKLASEAASISKGLPPGGDALMTLPGAVAWAAAAVERRPLPAVRALPFGTFERGTAQPLFDEVCDK